MKVPELYWHKQELAKAPAKIQQLVAAEFGPSVVEELEAFKGPRFEIYAITPLINKISAYLCDLRVKYGLDKRIAGPVLFTAEHAATAALYFRVLALVESQSSSTHSDIGTLFSRTNLQPHAFYFVVNEEVPTWAAAFEVTWSTGQSFDGNEASAVLGNQHLDVELRLAAIDIIPFSTITGQTIASSDFEHFLEFEGTKSGSVKEKIEEIMKNDSLDTWGRTLAIQDARKRTLEHSNLDERHALFKLYMCQTWAAYHLMCGCYVSFPVIDRIGEGNHNDVLAFRAKRLVALADSELLQRYPDLSKLYFHMFFSSIKLSDTTREMCVEYIRQHEFVLKLLELGDAGLLEQLYNTLKGELGWVQTIFTSVSTARMVQAARGKCIGPVFKLCTMAIGKFPNLGKPENIGSVVTRYEEVAHDIPAALATLEFLAELLALNPTETVRVVHDTPLVRLLFEALHIPGLAPQAGLVLGRLFEQDQITYSVVDAAMWDAALQTQNAAALAHLCAGMAMSETGQTKMAKLGLEDHLMARVLDDCFESQFYSETPVTKLVDTLSAVPAFMEKMLAQIGPLLARLRAVLDSSDEEAFDQSGCFRRDSRNYGALSRVLIVLGSLAHQRNVQDELHARFEELVACLAHPHLPLDSCRWFSRQKFFRTLFDELFSPDRALDMLEMCINEVAEFAEAVEELPPGPGGQWDPQSMRRGRLFIDIYFSLMINKSEVFVQHVVPIILCNPVYKQLTLDLPWRLAEVLEREARCLEEDPEVAECFWQSSRQPSFHEEKFTLVSCEFALFDLSGLDADEYWRRKRNMQIIRFTARGLCQFFENVNCLARTACQSQLLVPGLYTPAQGMMGLLAVLKNWSVNTTAQRYALAAIIDMCTQEVRGKCGSYDFVYYRGYTIVLELFERLLNAPSGEPVFVNGTTRSDFVSECRELVESLLFEITTKVGGSALEKHRMHLVVEPPSGWMIEPAAQGIFVSLKSATRGITPPRSVTSILRQFDTEHDLRPLEYLLSFIEQHWRTILAKADSIKNQTVTLMAQVLLSLQYSFRSRFDQLVEELSADGAPLLAAMLVLEPQLNVSVSPNFEGPTNVQCIFLKHARAQVPLERLQALATNCVKPSDVFFLSEYILGQINQQALAPSPDIFDLLKGTLPVLLANPDRYAVCAFLSLQTALKALFEGDALVSVCGMTRAITNTLSSGESTFELDSTLKACFGTNATCAQQALEQLAYIDNKTSMVYLKSRLDDVHPPCCSHDEPLSALSEQMLLWSIKDVLQCAPVYVEVRNKAQASALAFFEYAAPAVPQFSDSRLNTKGPALATYKADWNSLRDHYLRLRFALDLVLPHCPSLANLIDGHQPLLESYFSCLLECTSADKRETLTVPEFVLIESLCSDNSRLVSLVLDSLMGAVGRPDKLVSILSVFLEAERSYIFKQILAEHPILAAIEDIIEHYPVSVQARGAKKYYFSIIGMLLSDKTKSAGSPSEDTSDSEGEDTAAVTPGGTPTDAADVAEADADETESNASLDSLADGLLEDDEDDSYQESAFYESSYTLNEYVEDDVYGRVMACPPRTLAYSYPHLFSLRSTWSRPSQDPTLEYEVGNVGERPKVGQQPYYRAENGFDCDLREKFEEHMVHVDWYTPRRSDQAYLDRGLISHSLGLDTNPFFQASQRIKWHRLTTPNGASKDLCEVLLRRNWRDGLLNSRTADWAALEPLPSKYEQYRKKPELPEKTAKDPGQLEDRAMSALRAAAELLAAPEDLASWGLSQEVVMALPEEMRLEVIASHLMAIQGPELTENEIMLTLEPELFADVAFTAGSSSCTNTLSLGDSQLPIVVADIKHQPPTYVAQFDVGTRLLCVLSHILTGARIPEGLWDERLESLALGLCCDDPALIPGFCVNFVKELRNFKVKVPLDVVFPLLLKPAIFYNSMVFCDVIDFIEKQADKAKDLVATSGFAVEASMPSQASLDTIFALLCSRLIDDSSLKRFIKLVLKLKNKKLLPPAAIEQHTCGELQRLLGASMESVALGDYASTTFRNLDVLLSRLVTFRLCSLDRNLELMAQLAESLSRLIPVALGELNENSLSLLRSYMYVTFVAPQTTATFLELFKEHGDAINNALLESPSLLNLCIKTLKGNYQVFSLDVKLKSLFAGAPKLSDERTKLSTLRSGLFSTAYRNLGTLSGADLAKVNLQIEFTGELGMDGGGLLREWFSLLGEDILDENYGFFKKIGEVYHPNVDTAVENYIELYGFLGKLMAKAVLSREPLGCNLSRVLYEAIVEQPANVKLGVADLEQLDPELAKSLLWMQENDITDILEEAFVASSSAFGQRTQHELKPGGASIAVTQENKAEYVELLVKHHLLEGIRPQLEALCQGFYSVIPHKNVVLFSAPELATVVCGTPEIDVEAWRSAVTYNGLDQNSPVSKWFWQFVRTISNKDRGELLRFVTGSPMLQRPPKFVIGNSWSTDGPPTSSVCTQSINLPSYKSYEVLSKNLRLAIEHSRGFGLV